MRSVDFHYARNVFIFYPITVQTLKEWLEYFALRIKHIALCNILQKLNVTCVSNQEFAFWVADRVNCIIAYHANHRITRKKTIMGTLCRQIHQKKNNVMDVATLLQSQCFAKVAKFLYVGLAIRNYD
jgi:hypothetical protein